MGVGEKDKTRTLNEDELVSLHKILTFIQESLDHSVNPKNYFLFRGHLEAISMSLSPFPPLLSLLYIFSLYAGVKLIAPA